MLLGQGTESLDHYDTDSKVRQISFQIPALPLSHSAFMPPSSPKKLISGTMYDLYVQPKHHYLHLVNGLVHHRSEFNFELLLMFRLKTAIPRGKKLEDHTMMEYREKLTLLDVQTIIFS